MSLTDDINRTLGELQNEIEKIRDGELIKSVKPFVEKTSELINKIDSMNLASKSDIEDSNLKINKNLENFSNKMNIRLNEQTVKVKYLLWTNIITIVILGVMIVKIFYK